jgi:hypothetical protein
MNLAVEIQVVIITALFAAIGYMVKSVIDWWQNRQKERARIIAEVQRLQSLLQASGEVFDIQQDQVRRLRELLKKNHPAEFPGNAGFEETMTRFYPTFKDDEQELHSIIRAYTEHSMRSVNLALSEWLRADELFKTGAVKSKREKQLAEKLFALEIHLLLWHAKYQAWIPNQPQHALVYMVDENQHGLGFPSDRVVKVNGKETKIEGVETEVNRVLEELRS